MKRRAVWFLPVPILLAALFVPSLPRASDHADPLNLTDPYSNITGLFIWPQGDQYVLVFNVRKSLVGPKPYPLSPYDYVVNIDLTTPVTFDSAEDRARYGGTIPIPDKIHPDVTIKIRLNNDTTLKEITYTGLKQTEQIRTYTGVRDDPFIFPRFFNVNVVSMVMSIPMSAFPDGQKDFILWGTTSKDGKQLDHVGRSVRSQLPRFGALNTVAPNDHVKLLMKEKKFWDDLCNYLNGNSEWWSQAIAGLIEFTFQIRKYDLAPDVMIYTSRFSPGYPNGRRLPDDVNAITCTTGDCLLQELSFIEAKDGQTWPRVTKNDKDFLPDWPYLAEPWADRTPPAPPTGSIWTYLGPILLVFAFVIWGLVEIARRIAIWLWHLLRHKFAAAH
jgi:hypothetical protein